MFEIEKTSSFNSDKLVNGIEYDYITRTSYNQGILQTTGFINEENINLAGNWSLGLLQMDFFYRKKQWYAGQFVRKVIPLFNLKSNTIPFITTVLNSLKPNLLNVLIRDVDDTFLNSEIKLPTKNNQIDFEFMESFVAELNAQRVAELNAYLTITGLKDYELTEEEKNLLENIDNIEYKELKIIDVFQVKNAGNILAREVELNSGDTPYLCASAENNSVSSYINYNRLLKDEGNCIFIGGKTFVVSYQEKDFYSNDSHNLALYLLDNEQRVKNIQLFLSSCIKKSLSHKYSWGDSISNKKIQKDMILVPIKDGKIDYEIMKKVHRIIEKLVIKDVVLWADKKIEATKQVANR